MTIATEIETITDYDSTDVSNAVTEATSFCTMHDVSADEIIKSAAIWLLDRLRLERRNRSDPSVLVPNMKELHELIEFLKGKEQDETDMLNVTYESPSERGLDPFG